MNIASSLELDNLEIAQLIGEYLEKDINYELVDYHTSRPGHDLRYALDGSVLKNLGWEANKSNKDGLEVVTKWYSDNQDWLRF